MARDNVIKSLKEYSNQFEGEYINEADHHNELIDLDNLTNLVKQGVSNRRKREQEAIARAKIKIENNQGAEL
jgi:hypothetical protein